MVNPTDALRRREQDLQIRNAIGAGVYGPMVGTPAQRLLPPTYGGGMTQPVPTIQTGVPVPPARPSYVPSGGYGGGGPMAQPPPPMPTGIVAGGGYGGGQTQPGPPGVLPGPSFQGRPEVAAPTTPDERGLNQWWGSHSIAYRPELGLGLRAPSGPGGAFTPLANQQIASAQPPGTPPASYPGGGYGGGSPVPTRPGLPPSAFSSPYGSGPQGGAAPPLSTVRTALPPTPSSGNPLGGFGSLPAFTYGDVQRDASAGHLPTDVPNASTPTTVIPPTVTSPAQQTNIQGKGGTVQPAASPASSSPANPPLPPTRPAQFTPVTAPIPPRRPANLGAASPAAVPQPPVTHVNGPAWLGALFRAGQQAPTGMSAMVNRPISDLGSGR